MERAGEYQIAAVARLTGIAPDTIRVWERRYALVQPARDASGIRRYTDAQVARLQLARRATALGHPIRRVAAMSDAELRRLLHTLDVDAAAHALAPTGPATAVQQVRSAIAAYDAAAAESALSDAALLLDGERFALEVLVPLLGAVGADWEAGALSIAQEHLVSTLVRNVLGSLARAAGARRSTGGAKARPMLFATPSGERHEFGVAIAAALAAMKGVPAILLGADVPCDEIVIGARRFRPGAVVIGTLRSPAVAAVSAYLAALDRDLPRAVELWVGGSQVAVEPPGRWSKRVRWIASLATFAELLA